jgi:hypothetical protein
MKVESLGLPTEVTSLSSPVLVACLSGSMPTTPITYKDFVLFTGFLVS